MLGQQRADVSPVGLADLRQHKARVLSYRVNTYRGGTAVTHQPTDLLCGLKALESMPQPTMRRGKIRINSSEKSSMISFPPSASTSARPRTSTPRGRQGGSTSSTTNAALPVFSASRNFLLAAMLCPPMSTVSNSGLLSESDRNDVRPALPIYRRKPAQPLFPQVLDLLLRKHAHSLAALRAVKRS